MKRVAIFDFDKTLITEDAEFPFLIFASNAVWAYAALLEGVLRYVLSRARRKQTEEARTFVKSVLLRHVLKGKKIADLEKAVGKTLKWQKFNEPVMRALREHRKNGDTIVIASGSLSLYLPQLLRDVPHDALICTDIGIEGGVVTGEMINGNCTRTRKAERVKAWLAFNGPFDESFGYGNAPHDLPMLELVKHRVIVG
jgi:HAD superfamily hydrolase (TIGR01490 family)